MNPRTLLTAIAALLAAAPAAGALAATSFAPGYYETVTRIAGEAEAEVQRDCVTPAEAKARTLEAILAEWTEGQCTYSQRQVGGGRFALAGACVVDGARSSFRHSGAYTPTSFSADLSARTVVSGQPIDLNLTVSSRRLAPTCPAAGAGARASSARP